MAVYVDNLRPCIPNERWRWLKSCHLIADTEEELHAFAKKLNLKRAWFQKHRVMPHYDLNYGQRKKAVELGAVGVMESAVRDMLRLRRRAQKKGGNDGTEAVSTVDF